MKEKIENSDKILFYTVDSDYIKKLQDVDYRVQNNYNGKRLYMKTNLESKNLTNDISYLVPLSSPKKGQESITNLSTFKLYGDQDKEDFLGILHINNMIPVPHEYMNEWSPVKMTNEDERYLMLVVKQAKYIKKHEEEILDSCNILYASSTGTLDPTYFKANRRDVMTYKKIMNDVNRLEKVSIDESSKVSYKINEFEMS